MARHLIPKAMSTQHPDNVNIPFFAENNDMGGEDEIHEAYYAFSHIGCDEQMWDHEGKEIDNFVIKKLLVKYESFFRDKQLGEELFITLRVPNPEVEKAEGKILLETLESIPRSFDAASIFYKNDVAPIFEVILPMTSSSSSLNRIHDYYRDFVAGKECKECGGGMKIGEWIGSFNPKGINVIPLFEDMKYMLKAADITKEYLEGKNLVEEQRVFLARSDPAMNYGNITAVLLCKMALYDLHLLEKEVDAKIYPIIGVGSAPFRGNLKPDNVERILKEYAGTHTFTLQSAFKYDNEPEKVRKAVEKIRKNSSRPMKIDKEKCLEIMDRYSEEYRKQVGNLAGTINKVATSVPKRRKRKLHVGLFGYARNLEGVRLPRVIKFTSALYSVGVPPEILGINALSEDDVEELKKNYVYFEEDLKDALKFYNPNSCFVPKDVKKKIEELGLDVEAEEEHMAITGKISEIMGRSDEEGFAELVLRAASIRKFLG